MTDKTNGHPHPIGDAWGTPVGGGGGGSTRKRGGSGCLLTMLAMVALPWLVLLMAVAS